MITRAASRTWDENGQIAFSSLFIVLFLVGSGAVFATSSTDFQTDIIQKVMLALAIALLPILIASSTLWLVVKSSNEAHSDPVS